MSAQARKHGINEGTVTSRMQRGMSLKKALTTPLVSYENSIAVQAREHGLNPHYRV
jgi:hypothetical protein